MNKEEAYKQEFKGFVRFVKFWCRNSSMRLTLFGSMHPVAVRTRDFIDTIDKKLSSEEKIQCLIDWLKNQDEEEKKKKLLFSSSFYDENYRLLKSTIKRVELQNGAPDSLEIGKSYERPAVLTKKSPVSVYQSIEPNWEYCFNTDDWLTLHWTTEICLDMMEGGKCTISFTPDRREPGFPIHALHYRITDVQANPLQ